MRILIFTIAQFAHILCADMNIATKYSAAQLAEIGRAMERKGFDNLNEFIIWACSAQAAETLTPSNPKPTTEK
jgi:hypothetical protein